MRRRNFIATVACTAAMPFAAGAQQKGTPVIGYLHPGSPGAFGRFTDAFRQGLAEAGYVEGRNVRIEYRWAEDDYDRLPALAGDLVGRQVDLIAVVTDIATQIAKAATASIPVVFFTGADPVADGLVASLARPGGNVTGITVFGDELNAKRLQLLTELVPQARNVAVLVNPNNIAADHLSAEMRRAADATSVRLQTVAAAAENEIERAFAGLAEHHADALIVTSNAWFFSRRAQIVAQAARAAVPTIYYRREFVDGGGLIAYGPSYAGGYHQIGALAGKILAGTKPADLPVEQPTTFELVVNMKTTKTLGLTVPPLLLAQADEVIE